MQAGSSPLSLVRSRFSLSLPAIATLCAFIIALTASLLVMGSGQASGGITVEVVAGYNLVVDSNVQAPSTYAPAVATVMGRFCNTSGATINNVTGFIGNFNNGTGSTPGTYPLRSSSVQTFIDQHNHLANTGNYSFTHVGGRTGSRDATRFMGSLAPGECKAQYWHFTYPRCRNNNDGTPKAPPCGSNTPVWGATNNTNDDLWLEFDIWGTGNNGATLDNKRWRMTMRNEITAMANKIQPNPDGLWFNTNTSIVAPGDVITSNGVLYTLGNINKGFDNDGDFQYDYNAWLQPIGDPSYDPSCFRLIRTSGLLTVKRSSMPDLIIPFTDQLYFTNLPQNNTGVRGLVYYTFQALDGPCSTSMSPYQEVASGADNEKYNADFGTGIPPIGSSAPTFTIGKNGQASIALGGTINYEIPFANTAGAGGKSIGLPLSSGLPLVISDTIPAGMTYVTGSATANNTVTGGVTVRYFNSATQQWENTEPAAANVRGLQWWLNSPLPATTPVTTQHVRFSVTVATLQTSVPTYPAIINNSCAQLGSAGCFSRGQWTTIISGPNSLSGFVWHDANRNTTRDTGDESATNHSIAGAAVRLYYDTNNNGVVDPGEPQMGTAQTTTNSASPHNYQFTGLPNGNYIVQVDPASTPFTATGSWVGYALTTVQQRRVTITNANVNNINFGFAPVLTVTKTRTSSSPARTGGVGGLVTYSIALQNTRPGDGAGPRTSCEYTFWSNTATSSTWTNVNFAAGNSASGASAELNGAYATASFGGGNRRIIQSTSFAASNYGGSVIKVEALVHGYVNSAVDQNANETLCLGLSSNTNTCDATTQNHLIQYQDLIPLVNSPRTLVRDVTNFKSWSWSDFTGNTPQILHLQAYKQGSGNTNVVFHLDSLGYRVTVDRCGDPSDTINPLPLRDTFDQTRLQFVSADPQQTTVDQATGVIEWANLGPLYAGGTRQINVTFRAIGTGTNVPNTATVNQATYSTGLPTNPGTSTALVNIEQGGSIGDHVWWDDDNNGVKNGAEIDFAGVRLTLERNNSGTWTQIATTTTNSVGFYQFSGLETSASGMQYRVQLDTSTLPGGSIWTATTGHTNPHNVTLTTATPNLDTADFGFRRATPMIVGSVWRDRNNNAASSPDPGEEGFSGWTVTLSGGPGCNPSACTTTTNASGNFFFTSSSLGIGNYTVTVSPAAGWIGTWDTGEDNDPSTPLVTPNVSTVPISAMNSIGRADFSYRSNSSVNIGDTVFRDWDGNGVQSMPSEEGIEGVLVELYQDLNGNGVIDAGTDIRVRWATTNASGNYLFQSIATGSYIVVVDRNSTPLLNHLATVDPDTNTNSRSRLTVDATLGTVTTLNCRTTITCNNLSFDYGFRPTGAGSIGDTVYRDNNRDGWQDAPETGIAGVIVTLYEDANGNGVIDAADAVLGTRTTDSSGKYLFNNLGAGRYLVSVSNTDPALPVDGAGIRFSPTTMNPRLVLLAADQNFLDADFGFGPSGIIGDFIWQDNNGNGTHDVGEPGLAGVQVQLYIGAPTGSPLATATTDSSGYYRFTGLAANTYTVVVSPPAGMTQTYDADATFPQFRCGPPDGVPCDNQSTVTIGLVPPPSGAPSGSTPYYVLTDFTRDFGYRPANVIGDFAWYDLNGNGIQDPGEPGVPGVKLRLQTAACSSNLPSCPTTDTDGDGYYSFGNLTPGNHTVSIINGAPSGWNNSYDPDTGTSAPDGSAPFTLQSDGSVTGVTGCTTNCNLALDFGYRLPSGTGAINGTAFFDAGNDGGLYNGTTDVPYQGVTVYLWRCNAAPCTASNSVLIRTTTTGIQPGVPSNTGYYAFDNVPPGNYTISVNTKSPQLDGLRLLLAGTDAPTGTAYRSSMPINNNTITQRDFGFHVQMDLGDLPTTYSATLLKDGGPRHIAPATGAIRLGSRISYEANGQESAVADGDRVIEGSESYPDDGIVRPSDVTWTTTTTAPDGSSSGGGTIQVTVAGGTGYLSGWVDWNRNGAFYDANGVVEPGERILVDRMLTAGTHTVTFPIPAGTSLSGVTYFARFRLYGATTSRSASPFGAAENGEVEDYQWYLAPTAVTLALFEAQGEAAHVVVRWETASELNNLGFNVYRSDSATGEAVQLNEELIGSAAPGSGEGFSYEFVDEDVVAGQSYYYWLEDVDTSGVVTRHGPISATVGAQTPTAVMLESLAAERGSGLPWLAIAGLLALGAGGLVLRRRSRA